MTSCRRATSEDAELFRLIRLKALKDSPEAFGSTYESAIVRSANSWQEQLDTTLSGDLRNMQFAFDGDECIGMVALYREEGVSYGDIIMMWVDQKYRGTTVASMLVTKLIDWARKVGFESVCLEVAINNERASRFYEKCGFSLTNSTDESMCEKETIRMRIVLDEE